MKTAIPVSLALQRKQTSRRRGSCSSFWDCCFCCVSHQVSPHLPKRVGAGFFILRKGVSHPVTGIVALARVEYLPSEFHPLSELSAVVVQTDTSTCTVKPVVALCVCFSVASSPAVLPVRRCSGCRRFQNHSVRCQATADLVPHRGAGRRQGT